MKVLLANLCDSPENLHLERALLSAAARRRNVRVDVMHDFDHDYPFLPAPPRAGVRAKYTEEAASRALSRGYDSFIALDFPKKRRAAVFFSKLFSGAARGRAYFLANHLAPVKGHNFAADLFRRLRLLSRARLAWALEYDDPSLWAGLGLEPVKFFRRPYCVDTGYYSPGRGDGKGGYVLSAGSAGRDFSALEKAAAAAGAELRVRSDSPRPAGFGRLGAAWEPFSPNLRSLRAELRASRLVALPVAGEFLNEAAGNSIAFMAMACGRPVLARDTVYMRGYIKDGVNGFLYDGRSRTALAAALKRALSRRPPALKVLGLRARKTMLERASLSALAASVLDAVRLDAPVSPSADF